MYYTKLQIVYNMKYSFRLDIQFLFGTFVDVIQVQGRIFSGFIE
jgi:hypothetical protein